MWRGKFYMQAILPMGAPSSCAIFEHFSTALVWAAKVKFGLTEVVHVIDDFLILSHSYHKCKEDLTAFVTMCEQLGVPLAPVRIYGPAAAIQFLGITLGGIYMEARIPEDKLAKARDLLVSFRDRQKVTVTELKTLVGFLNFACSVIVPGRPFFAAPD